MNGIRENRNFNFTDNMPAQQHCSLINDTEMWQMCADIAMRTIKTNGHIKCGTCEMDRDMVIGYINIASLA